MECVAAMMDVQVRGGDGILKELERIAVNARSARVKMGYLATERYPDGTPVAQVAFWQEFGTPGARFPIPPRPTFRTMITKHKGEWGAQLADQLEHGKNSHEALAIMGEVMADELKESVQTADVKELSPVTLMLRKMANRMSGAAVTLRTVYEAIRRVKAGEQGATGTRAKRLVDTGQMQSAPTYTVIDHG